MAKYIAMSDLHLGQNGKDCMGQYSLLSRVPDECPNEKAHADAVMAKLCDKVTSFAHGDPVTLILVGDVLDLALAYIHDALADLGNLLAKLDPVKHIIWVTGNHDTHIWTLHSEDKRCLGPMRNGELPDEGGVYRITSPQGEPLTILQPMLSKQAGRDLKVDIACPTFKMTLHDNLPGLPPPVQDVDFCFTHGHLLGGIYTLVSRIVGKRLPGFTPERTAATVNQPLIEFIYWLLGETGEGLGADGLVETVYTDIQKGDSSVVNELIGNVVESFFADGLVPGIPDSWERSAIKKLAYALLKKAIGETKPTQSTDRHEPSPATRRALETWAIEVLKLSPYKRAHVIYGHTHHADLHPIHSTSIIAYNLGSWLVEPNVPPPQSQLMTIEDGPNKLEVKWSRIE